MRKIEIMTGAGLTIGLVVVLLGGCAGTATVVQPTGKNTANTNAALPNGEKAVVAPEESFLSGKVVETMNATGYTYIQLEKEGKKAWFAVPGVSVSIGQEVEVLPGMQMGLFKSKSLNKTFDSIVFAPGLVADPNAPLPPAAEPAPSEQPSVQPSVPPGHPPMDAASSSSSGKATREQLVRAGVLPISGKVVETMNSGGYTYILIDSGDKKIWGAVPTMEVTVGQEIQLLPGQTMTNFNSKSLNRTFDSVIFSTGVVPVTKQ
jgi:hypothetical protein